MQQALFKYKPNISAQVMIHLHLKLPNHIFNSCGLKAETFCWKKKVKHKCQMHKMAFPVCGDAEAHTLLLSAP